MSSVFGPTYLDVATFRSNARRWGCAAAINGDSPYSDQEIEDLLAEASRAIDSHVGRPFTTTPLTEQHRLDYRTRRIEVNAPPVSSIQSLVLRTSPQQSATLNLSALYINNQERYIEIASFALVPVQALMSPLIALGIEPVLEITYTSFTAIPQNIALACGREAAARANLAMADDILVPGLQRLKSADVEVQREQHRSGNAEAGTDRLISPLAVKLLGGDSDSIAVG